MSTFRVLKGKRNSGAFGYDVSRPGFDVRTANLMQLAFSSDYIAPLLVVAGTVVAAPTSGPAPNGSGSYPGAVETVTTISFGRTISPIPAVFAIASAPGWNVPLTAGAAGQLGYLANQWHTFLKETMPVTGTANDNTYGPTIGRASGATTVGFVDFTWASAKFIAYTYADRVEFRTNCNNNLTIKYLVLES